MSRLSVYHEIIGKSRQMADIFARIGKAAAGDVNVCIHGESGTGKELIARAIHYASPRRDRPLNLTCPHGHIRPHVAENCCVCPGLLAVPTAGTARSLRRRVRYLIRKNA